MAHSAHATLIGHPDNPEWFDHRVDATLLRMPDGGIGIAYSVRGPLAALRLPTAAAPAPADALWHTTCCELFVAANGAFGYREFNFSPDGQWTAYDFLDYRKRAPEDAVIPPPALRVGRSDLLLQLDALLPPAALPGGDSLRFALSVVLEAADGRCGFWALGHPPAKPDFHHRDGFALALGPSGFRS